MKESCEFDAEVTKVEVEAFAQLSGDRNPLHLDPAYAQTTEFGRPIVHGALLIAFVSRVLGMHLPGARCLILSVKVQFPKPLYYPARVRVSGRLKQFNAERETGSVHVVVTDGAKGWPVLEAEAAFSLHALVGRSSASAEAGGSQAAAAQVQVLPESSGPRRRLLVTGGTGGIGSHVLHGLARHYDLRCVTRKPVATSSSPDVAFDRVDLEEPGAWERYLAGQDPAGVYGVVHMSAPAVSRGFLSDDVEAARRHWRHAVEVPLAAVHWARQAGSGVKRIILLGSTAGSKHPQPHEGAYSLGKAAMEHMARLLTGDLSAQGATINVVAPTVVPVGMHEGLSERARKALIGKMPTGRLVEPRDIASVILFLLTAEAFQINGAVLAVDGGMAE